MTIEFCWLIGGSPMSIPMAKEIKRRGYKLLLTDKNEHCACREYADEFYPISVYDEVKSLELAKVWKWSKVVDPEPFQRQIAAVLCIGCDAGPTVSLASDYLGLPSVGHEVARRVKDKLAVRESLDLDYPYYDSTLYGTMADDSFSFQYPLIVKPLSESGSKGFRVATNNTDLQEAIEAIDGEAIIEELLIGQDVIPEWRDKYGFDTSEIALDFFVQDGKVYYANGALRLFWSDMPGIEAGHINPYIPGPEIIKKAQHAAEKLGVAWGPFKCDFKQDKRYGWVIMECASRLSGGFDHMYTCPLATGKDITGAMLDVASGKPLAPVLAGKSVRITFEDAVFESAEPLTPMRKIQFKRQEFACAYAPRFRPGKINGWLKMLLKGDGYQLVVPATDGYDFYLENQEIKPLESNQQRPLFVIRKGQTMDEALEAAMRCAERIKPKYV